MITKYQAGITIGFALAIIFDSQVSGERLRLAVSRASTETAPELGSQNGAVSDRSGERLNSDGAMYGVNLLRTRVYDAQGLQEPKSVLWKTPKLFTMKPERSRSDSRDLFFSEVVPPAYRGGASIITTNKEAYFSWGIDDGELLFVIDLQTGETKKTFKWQNGGFSTPVVAGDLLFLGAGDGKFYSFDRRDWKEKWKIGNKGYHFDGAYPAVAYGMLYFGGDEGYYERHSMTPAGIMVELPQGVVYAVDALNGAQKWMFKIKGGPTPMAVADEVIYFGDGEHNLFAVNAKDGKKIWKFTASDRIRRVGIMDDRAFFSDRSGNLYAVDLKNGKAIWKATKLNKVATPLAAYNKLVYYGGEENSLFAVDALTGEVKWVYRTTQPCLAPVVANGVVYVASKDNAILAIDAESGQEKWKYKTPQPPISYPVVGNGVIYFLDEEGVMYALGSA